MASWTLIAILAAVLVTTFNPAYAICSSSVLTVISAILAAWILRFIYSAALYPTFFTPLKHIPMPPVSRETMALK